MRTASGIYRQKLDHPGGRTEIVIGAGALSGEASGLADWLEGRTVFVLSTPRLAELHGEVLESLGGAAARVVRLEVPDGEQAKSLAHAGRLWDEMLESGGKRDSRLIAFGGGTVGDLGGFVAGCFLRGIEVVQAPTTLLAQVDAAIGGKTAIDLTGGKNTVGLFHHPARVIEDTALLATLPRAELRSGLVEVVKMAALLSPPLLERVEQELDALLAADAAALAPVVAGAAAAKCGVVERDPAEGGWRRILNFGHTLGHAIEGALNYSHLRHGEAVAYGMLFALQLAHSRGLDETLGERLRGLLGRFELPPLPPLEPADLWALMSRDKKATESGLTWVLPRALGHGEMVSGIDRGEVFQQLETFLPDPFARPPFSL
ncbi:MAG: 3-dehydroquinate synthase [bacterium]|nr:3-dehydroquinate synthase [bacterium]